MTREQAEAVVEEICEEHAQWLDAAYNPELDGDDRLEKVSPEELADEYREWLRQDAEYADC